eukprot:c12840_g1_i1.p1 GENE.c12840_g1_i1~~c12840_g1_i1.p1  ORF type:complete len:604 (+),score=187.91 c12840_g1_i1:22-1812(+)
MMKLFHDDEEDKIDVRVNQDFAKRFEHNKRREELQRLQAKGLDEEESDASSSTTEDEDAMLLTPQVDAKIHETLARLRRKDPTLYQQTEVFKDEDFEQPKPKQKAAKPMYLSDYERELLLEKGGIVDSDEETAPPKVKSLADEQEELKRAFLEAATDSDSDKAGDKHNKGDDDGGLVFKKRAKTAEQLREDEMAFKEFRAKRGQYLEEYFGDSSNLNDEDKFLKDYLENQRWLDADAPNVWNKPLQEIAKRRKKQKKEKKGKGNADDENGSGSEGNENSDDSMHDNDHDSVEAAERFEVAFQHRYQEENAHKMMTHPREVPGSVRDKDSKRRKQREERATRDAQRKAQKAEELKRLKALKRAEIEEKINQIRGVAGEQGLSIDESMLEGDFDPDAFDRGMKTAFGDDYYATNAELPEEDTEQFLSKFDDYEAKLDSTVKVGKRRRSKKGFAEIAQKARELGQCGTKEAIEKMLDEYYKLDYEDLIGDLPTRFKYKTVPANDFGMSKEEILLADDKVLNQVVSIKKLAPYREKEWRVAETKIKKLMSQHVQEAPQVKPWASKDSWKRRSSGDHFGGGQKPKTFNKPDWGDSKEGESA